MTPHEQRAEHGRGALSKSVGVRLAAEHHEDTPGAYSSQASDASRQHEAEAYRCALAALRLRGGDAFAQAALAGFHARAAVALMTGAQHV